MAEFRVVLENIELPPEREEEINKAIRRAVLPLLADIDFGGDVTVRLPTEPIWRGIIFIPGEEQFG